MTFATASDIEPRAAEWLLDGRVPYGFVSVLTGEARLGKSTLTRWLAAREQTGAVILSAEDDPHVMIRPSLEAFGADLTRMHVLVDQFSLRASLGVLDSLLESTHARLVVVDPLSAFLDGVPFG